MKAWLAITDGNWYNFLRHLPRVAEVDFWRPRGSKEFTTLAVGEPPLFKPHYPQDSEELAYDHIRCHAPVEWTGAL